MQNIRDEIQPGDLNEPNSDETFAVPIELADLLMGGCLQDGKGFCDTIDDLVGGVCMIDCPEHRIADFRSFRCQCS